jgi:hypothetical protein
MAPVQAPVVQLVQMAMAESLPKKIGKFNPLPCTDLATDLLLSA